MLTIESERLLIMSRSFFSPCAACGDEVRMLTVDQAASLSRVNSREIYREVRSRRASLHGDARRVAPHLLQLAQRLKSKQEEIMKTKRRTVTALAGSRLCPA